MPRARKTAAKKDSEVVEEKLPPSDNEPEPEAPAEKAAEKKEPEAEPAAGDTSITTYDLQVMCKVISVGLERGAYRGNEIAAIGLLHDKLSAIIDASAKSA